MGFDLYGVNAKTESGEYFRNNVWWWRPLWHYTHTICEAVLSDSDMEAGGYNDGHLINEDKALAISSMLQAEIGNGNTKVYADKYLEESNNLPLTECDLCKGTGIRRDEHVNGKCNKCDGKGEVKQWQTMYPFDVDNVKEFAKFCAESGGFEIC